jgi:hypothetical protein
MKMEDPSPATPSKSATKNNAKKENEDDEDFWSRKGVLVGLGVLVVISVVAIVAGVVLGVNKKDDIQPKAAPAVAPTLAPAALTAAPIAPTNPPNENSTLVPGDDNSSIIPKEEQEALLDLFATVVGDKVKEPGTTQYQAAEWMFQDDPRLILLNTDIQRQSSTIPEYNLTDDEWMQRYTLVYFYYSTTNNLETSWRSCGAPTFLNQDDDDTCLFQKLVAISPEFQYVEVPWIRWLTAAHECDWAGVSCDTMVVDGMTTTVRSVTGLDLGTYSASCFCACVLLGTI